MKLNRLLGLGQFLVLVGLTQPALAADFYVTDTNDNWNLNGLCSLREAVYAAVSDFDDAGDCGNGDSEDEIHLVDGATYTLTEQLRIELYNASDKITISVPNDFDQRAIIKPAPGKTILGIVVTYGQVDLYHVTLREFSGPAVFVTNAQVYLDNVWITENSLVIGGGQSAGLVAGNNASVLVSLSSIWDNTDNIKGGAIFVGTTAYVEVEGSYLGSNWVSQYGGGVHVQGAFVCSTTQITGNSAGISGGGIYRTSTGFLDLGAQCIVSSNSAPSDPNIHF